MTMQQIKHRHTGSVLFEYESGSGLSMREALEKATTAKANLYGANLYGADLGGANLYGANLGGKKLIGGRPFFIIGPIGSRGDYVQAWITDAGVMIRAGCFFDTRNQFELALDATHGQNNHGQEYRAALVLIDKHAELWTPKELT